MSLPTSSSGGKLSQPSIRSFFQPKTPTYAAPPAQTNGTAVPLSPPPPPLVSALASATPSLAAPVSSHATPRSAALADIPSEASVRRISTEDVPALRRINSLLLPVSYPDTFYERAIDPALSGPFSRVITWAHHGEAPKVVGGVVCRLEAPIGTKSEPHVAHTIYIQSLCLLAPYRSKGLINAAVEDIIHTAVHECDALVTSISAHVWTENEEGLKWYEGRGFQRQEPPIKGYYIKLRPDSAWLVRRTVSPMSLKTMPARTVASTGLLSPSSQPPPMASPTNAPPRTPSGQSFQNQRPETEWNDLPADMAPTLLTLPRKGSEPGSSASSRSSSTVRKKKDRSYPAAAFGS
ncbi:hypothetical protein B0I35DRAFT_479316 [Stachybotrys elegans]|uniref:N-acetyltransferase domain-containing protein n=1 Tax=Stachybotrys elegans TaxID=80388 RepID=A0A8K0SPB3_9HYPO|nr:hypothetical protein B0I35DRAFT_479316 [Stachybotrys elegans]